MEKVDVRILVIIVTYNGMKWIERCLNSLQRSSIKPTVFLIDNGSTDGTQAFVKNNYSEVMFTQSPENLGFGRANNVGLRYALENNFDYVYLLNQDAWVFPDTLQILVDAHRLRPQFGVLSPMQCQANGTHLDDGFLACIANEPDILNDCALGVNLEQPHQVKIVMAAHWLISQECLTTVGLFSPTFPHYGEDINYRDRLNYWGLKMGVVPAARAIHDREKRPTPLKKRLHQFYMSQLRFLSNPMKSPALWVFFFISSYFKLVVRYKTLRGLGYFFKIVSNMPSIFENKKCSLEQKAFIK